MRNHLILGRLGSIVLLAAALGCATSAGPVAVSSRGLGYEGEYMGARVHLDGKRGAFVSHVELTAYDSNKVATGDGWTAGAVALAGVAFGPLALFGGGRVTRQETSAWERTDTSPVVQVEAHRHRGKYETTLALRYSAPDSSQYRTRSASAIAMIGNWVKARIAIERAWFTAAGVAREGSRVEAGVLFKIGGKD